MGLWGKRKGNEDAHRLYEGMEKRTGIQLLLSCSLFLNAITLVISSL